MFRNTLMLPLALTLLTACDEATLAADDEFTDPIALRSESPANPCEALTPAAFDDALAAIDAVIAQSEAHLTAHETQHSGGAGDFGLSLFVGARDKLADQIDDVSAYNDPFLSNASLAGGTYQVTALQMAAYLNEAIWWAGVTTAYEHCNEGQATALLGLQAQQRVQKIGADAFACFVRGSVSCGNGVVDTGEECDDGNTRDGDDCSMLCQDE